MSAVGKAMDAVKAAGANLRTALLGGVDTRAARRLLAEAEREAADLAAREAADIAKTERVEEDRIAGIAAAAASARLAEINAGLAALTPRPAPGPLA